MTLIATKCGGPGSGVPGPCPSHHEDHTWHSVGIRFASQSQLDALEKAKNADRVQGVMKTNPKIELVPIGKLVATQKRLAESVVESYRGKPLPEHGKDKGTILGIRLGGNVYIDDGHHRIFAGAKDGLKAFKMDVIDLDVKTARIRTKLKIVQNVVKAATELINLREKKLSEQLVRDRAMKVHDAQSAKLEDKLAAALEPMFKKQIESAASKLGTGYSRSTGPFNPRDWDEELVNRALPPIAQAMAESMMAQAIQLHTDLKKHKKSLELRIKCGGPGSGIPGPCPGPVPKPDPHFSAYVRTRAAKVRHRQAMKEIEKVYPPSNPKGHDTEAKYRKFDGSYTKERQALHDKIIAEALSKATPVQSPVSFMMGGGSGSGKSSAMSLMNIPKNIVHIDTDELKTKLPEYQQMLKARDSRAAAYTHYETAHIAKRMLDVASRGGYHLMLDGTGNTSMGSVMKRVGVMKREGRKIIANYVNCDVKTAMARNVARAKETGRFTPEHILKENHRSVSQLVPDLIKAGVFDSFKLYDTSGGKTVHVASAAGSTLVVHDKELWKAFLDKGKYHHHSHSGQFSF